jgi:hypothetical protein
MRVSLKAAIAALALMLGATVFAAPSEARSAFHGGDGIVAVRDHGGYGYRRGYYRHGFHGGPRHHYRGAYFGGGPRYYRHGGFYRDRGFYGRRHHFRGAPGYYARHHHYRGNGVVIRLR